MNSSASSTALTIPNGFKVRAPLTMREKCTGSSLSKSVDTALASSRVNTTLTKSSVVLNAAKALLIENIGYETKLMVDWDLQTTFNIALYRLDTTLARVMERPLKAFPHSVYDLC